MLLCFASELRKSVKDHVEVDQAAGGEGQGAGRRAGPSRAAPPPLDGMSIPSGGSLFANMFAPPPEEEVPAVEEAPASSRRLFRDVHGVDEAKGELQVGIRGRSHSARYIVFKLGAPASGY